MRCQIFNHQNWWHQLNPIPNISRKMRFKIVKRWLALLTFWNLGTLSFVRWTTAPPIAISLTKKSVYLKHQLNQSPKSDTSWKRRKEKTRQRKIKTYLCFNVPVKPEVFLPLTRWRIPASASRSGWNPVSDMTVCLEVSCSFKSSCNLEVALIEQGWSTKEVDVEGWDWWESLALFLGGSLPGELGLAILDLALS